ncbi:hypothetical protein [Rhizobium sp. SL86]|uniref:hypothetical protein n=1 Tax=Rhizobium sp. SL86 TaxID=2995148 RepID=UPI0022730632|nr:hypothetical protein [Rhizobium sp. SL86]MCY1666202.1 hypothetical protein [Rhizobium sp. SL86]
MMMFTRLKIRPIETILLFVAFNLVAVLLIAVKAMRMSPEILGFSILAALSACAAMGMIALTIDMPLRRLARDAQASQRAGSTPHEGPESRRRDEIGVLARALMRPQPALPETPAQPDETLRRIDETLRRLSNGDLNCQIQEEFEGPFEALRMRVNRLAAMLNVNLYAMRENSAVLKEQARSSQGDLAVIGDRITNAIPTAKKASTALDVLQRSARLRHDDAEFIARRVDALGGTDRQLTETANSLRDAGDGASRSLDRLTELAHAVGDLAIQAEQLSVVLQDEARQGEDPAKSDGGEPVRLTRALADSSMQTARNLLRQCRETEQHVAESNRALLRLERSAVQVGSAIAELKEPAERLARNADLEMQRLSLAHLAAAETDNVLARSLDIVQASEGALIRMMSEVSAVETRLAAFQFAAPAQSGRTRAGEKPNLRCIT